MVIIGTGGIAKDLVGWLDRDYRFDSFYFYNNMNANGELFVDQYPVITRWEDLEAHLKVSDRRFVSAIGNPLLRYRMNKRIEDIGGVLTSLASCYKVSRFSNVGKGCIIPTDVIISSCVTIGEGTFINSGTIVGHDVTIGDYCSFGPGARILGHVSIGDFSYIGCNSVITPGVKIGEKVRIGIGKIIDRDVPDNSKIV